MKGALKLGEKSPQIRRKLVFLGTCSLGHVSGHVNIENCWTQHKTFNSYLSSTSDDSYTLPPIEDEAPAASWAGESPAVTRFPVLFPSRNTPDFG